MRHLPGHLTQEPGAIIGHQFCQQAAHVLRGQAFQQVPLMLGRKIRKNLRGARPRQQAKENCLLMGRETLPEAGNLGRLPIRYALLQAGEIFLINQLFDIRPQQFFQHERTRFDLAIFRLQPRVKKHRTAIMIRHDCSASASAARLYEAE